jgi:hypothetical protein
MAMATYVLVLARNTHQGAKYAQRAKLPRGRYRVVTSAASIRGLRRAECHIVLPGFDSRPDRHSILSELKWARCEFFTVELPDRETAPPVDQGDGMGEQLTIEDAMDSAHLLEQHSDALQTFENAAHNDDVTTIVAAAIEHNVEMTEALEAHAERDQSQDHIDDDDEEFCPVCFAGTESSQHLTDPRCGAKDSDISLSKADPEIGIVEAEDVIPELSASPGDLIDPDKANEVIKKKPRPRKPVKTSTITPPAGMFD